MDEWITLTEFNWAFWVAGAFALLEFFKWAWSSGEWLVSKFGIETKHTKAQKEVNTRLTKVEKDIEEIKETAKTNVQMFLDHEVKVVSKFEDISDSLLDRLETLDVKIDKQQMQLENKLEDIDKAGKARDCAFFRDRLIQSIRYFSQRRNENGIVYVSITEFENLQHMFAEYFGADGNGSVKQIYEQDFLPNFRIDHETIDIHK